MQKNKRKPYSKYYGQGDPEWWCPTCKNPIPDEQEELRCLVCGHSGGEIAPYENASASDMSRGELLHLRQLQRHIHHAIGRTVPFEQILGILKKLAESDDETSSGK